MSGLSSLDGVRRVFKELSDSLESAQVELSELRKANYMLRTEVEYLRAIKDTGYHDSGAICECRCGTKFQSRRVVSHESTEVTDD